MKNTVIYLLILIVFFGMTYFLNSKKEPEFKWDSTYNQHDKQPFGAYVLDELLKNTLKESYTHTYRSIYQLLNEDDIENQNLMILADYFELSEEDQNDLLQYVKEGNNVMIASTYFSSQLLDSLHLSTEASHFDSYISSKLNIREHLRTVSFYGSENRITRYRFPSVMLEVYFKPYSVTPAQLLEFENDSTVADRVEEKRDTSLLSPVIILAEGEDEKPVLLKYPIGKGSLILSCTPKIFTNYGILDPVNSGYIWQTLGYLQNKPLIRTENHQVGTDQPESPLRYFLSNRSLRWGLYTTLVAIILLMIFTAKRKQRAIPVIKNPDNKMLSFVRSIAVLYLRKNNNADIVRKKYLYRSDQIKRKYGLDIVNREHDSEFCALFAAKTGQSPNDTSELFGQLDAIRDDSDISDKEMEELVKKINKL